MTQSVLPPDKTFRMAVKLVSTDGNELPFEGFMLVPEGRLVSLEKLAVAAKDLVTYKKAATADPSKAVHVETAVQALDEAVAALEQKWDIPVAPWRAK